MSDYEAQVAAQAAAKEQKDAIFARAKENLEKAVGEGRLKGADETEQYRAFYAPVAKNTRFLVREGKTEITEKRGQDGARLKDRVGDIWLQFIDGIAVMNSENDEDAVRIAWCEGNPGICRDITDPFTEAWAYMKEMQYPTAWRDATLPTHINVERLLQGDASGNSVKHTSVDHARKQLEDLSKGGK